MPQDKAEKGAGPNAGGPPNHKQDTVELKLRSMTKNLPSEDREEILRFAEYLRHKKIVTRAEMNPKEDRTP
jgi:hypothetical protein